MIELSQERYDRVKAAHLTRYSLGEILAAAREYEAAEADVRTLSEEAGRQLDAFIAKEEETTGMPAGTIRNLIRWTEYLDGKMGDLYFAVCRANDATRVNIGSRSANRGGGDLYPLTAWRKAAASQRAAARRIRSALPAK